MAELYLFIGNILSLAYLHIARCVGCNGTRYHSAGDPPVELVDVLALLW